MTYLGITGMVMGLALLVPRSSSAQSPIVIDEFTTAQPLIITAGAGTTQSSTVTTMGVDILGGERDVEVEVVAGSFVAGDVAGGIFNFSVGAATTGRATLAWDGGDGLGNSDDIDPVGLGAVDLTNGGTLDAFRVAIVSSDQPGSITIRAFTDGNNASEYTAVVPQIPMPVELVMPFGAFTTINGVGADFENIGALVAIPEGFELDMRIALIQSEASLEVEMTDALIDDVNGDGAAGEGDTIQYTVEITNIDDLLDALSAGVLFDFVPDANTTLVAGSVTTSQGTVTTGNTPGDMNIAVDIGEIVDGDTVTVTFEILINPMLPPGVTEISAQGTISGSNLAGLPTDDPDDPTSDYDDPTLTSVIYCGSGIIDPGEICDDGPESMTCDNDCTPAACGDGTVNMAANEECDDVKQSATCDDDCTLAVCGDGTVNSTAGEVCDDSGESDVCDIDCTPVMCGDGTPNSAAGEECDDGGESDACDADCTAAICGDNTINASAGEECDDGGESEACDIDCTAPMCGDGVANTTVGEECDDGLESGTCDADCTAAMCGDGTLNITAGEQCDDGNTADGDDCPGNCITDADIIISGGGCSAWGSGDVTLLLGALLLLGVFGVLRRRRFGVSRARP